MTTIHHSQPARDLVEFSFIAEPVPDLPDTYDLKAELRLGQAEVDESGLSEAFTVRLRRVFIQLDYSGSTIMPGSKFGEPVQKNDVTTKKTLKKEASVDLKAGSKTAVNFDLQHPSSVNISASADAAASAAQTLSYEEQTDLEVLALRVKARGNDRWEVAELNGEPLDGKILNHETLCHVRKTAGSNAVLIGGMVLAKQKDFRFDINKGFIRRMTQNDRKLLSVFLAKKLADGEFNGEIVLADLNISL